MKLLTIIFIAALLPVISRGELNIVATTPEYGAIAAEIGGDHVQVTTLAKPTEDSHFVDAKPSFIAKLHRADVIIEGGAELETGWLPSLLEGARNPKLDTGKPGHVICAEGISLLDIPASLDRSKGDIHAAGNPHFMTDPVNGKIVAEHICRTFCELDSKSADFYRENLAKFNKRIDSKLIEWQKLFEQHKGKRIVAYHNSWPYFAQRFGVRIDLFLEPKPGIPPTPANLASVQSGMKTQGVRVIIVEPYQNRKTAENVAQATGAAIVDVAQYPGGVKGTEGGYIELIDYLVKSIAKALSEKADK